MQPSATLQISLQHLEINRYNLSVNTQIFIAQMAVTFKYFLTMFREEKDEKHYFNPEYLKTVNNYNVFCLTGRYIMSLLYNVAQRIYIFYESGVL